MKYLLVHELTKELRRIANEQKLYRTETISILNQAADRLERYNELFKWLNENCRECGKGRPILHPQPLPDPDNG